MRLTDCMERLFDSVTTLYLSRTVLGIDLLIEYCTCIHACVPYPTKYQDKPAMQKLCFYVVESSSMIYEWDVIKCYV